MLSECWIEKDTSECETKQEIEWGMESCIVFDPQLSKGSPQFTRDLDFYIKWGAVEFYAFHAEHLLLWERVMGRPWLETDSAADLVGCMEYEDRVLINRWVNQVLEVPMDEGLGGLQPPQGEQWQYEVEDALQNRLPTRRTWVELLMQDDWEECGMEDRCPELSLKRLRQIADQEQTVVGCVGGVDCGVWMRESVFMDDNDDLQLYFD